MAFSRLPPSGGECDGQVPRAERMLKSAAMIVRGLSPVNQFFCIWKIVLYTEQSLW
jgi:hypothetical protein